jgi:hypothetical protein
MENLKFVTSASLTLRPSVRKDQVTLTWRIFMKFFSIFRKFVEKIQIPLKSDKNNGYVTWRPIYIFDHISLTSS